jgi:hypothetical protein
VLRDDTEHAAKDKDEENVKGFDMCRVPGIGADEQRDLER